jgi:hypothetical protein
MRVQTYVSWVHRHAAPRDAGGAAQLPDDLTGIIDALIAQVAYYPSFVIQITPDADGLLIKGAQRVVQTEEQLDGMVVLRTPGSNVWITHADYQHLLA